MQTVRIITFLGIIFVCIVNYCVSYDLDDVRKELVISQFKEKLISHFKHLNLGSIITGVGHRKKWSKRNNVNTRKILEGIEGIREIPTDNFKPINKILIPGIKAQKCGRNGYFCVKFLMPDNLSKNKIDSAKFLLAINNSNNGAVRWKISSINTELKTFPLYQKTHPSYSGIHEIECQQFLRQLLDDNYEINKGKYITLKLRGKQSDLRIISLRTIILLVGSKATPKRYRRRAEPRKLTRLCTNSTIFCCLTNFTVSPADLNMHNLISPDLLHLNYCRGECNNYSLHLSTHARYLSILKRSRNSRLSRRQLENMRSCCTPVHYSKLEIQYREYTQIIKTTEINDMIVASCGCN